MPASISVCGRHRHRDRADDVGAAGFLAIGQTGPVHVGRRDDVDRAAAVILRRALQERVAAAHQRAGAERRVHLVRREHDVVEVLRVVVRLDVDAAVRRQLRRIDEDPGADRVRLSRQAMDGLDEAGDVRRAADGHQRDALAVAASSRSTSSSSSRPSRVTPRAHHLRATPPGQIVRVVLHHGGEHHAPRRQRIAEGELVDRFGGVLAEDDRVGRRVGADEARDGLVRLVIRRRAHARLEAGAAVHARVVGQEALDASTTSRSGGVLAALSRLM